VKPAADHGYAIVAAVGALAVFAAIAYAVLASDRGALAELRGEYAQARLEAAADAGLAKAIEGLGVSDVTRRWPIDGRARTLVFEGVTLTVVVEDERGKVPLSDLSATQLRRLFAGAGANDDRVRALVDAFEDLIDPSSDPRRHAAQLAQYRARGISPKAGVPATVDELARLNGMDPAVFAKIRHVLTPYFGASGPFTPDTASPLAIDVMSEGSENGPEALERQRALNGDRPALEIAQETSMAGHAVTVAVRAEDSQGGLFERRTVVEFSGASTPAYYIREEQ
jgi:general secretion pathway protein K